MCIRDSCIGAINESGIQYCVNPDTREFSATESNGNLIFSFVLPGDNASNEIESVLTVGVLVLLVADRFPRHNLLTPAERSEQYEVSVFEQGGEFIRTNELTVDLGSVESDEAQLVIDRGDPFDGIRARVVAFQREGSNPQLLFGWHGFRGRDNEVSRTDKWTMAGVSRFDLVTGERRVTRLYPLQEIDDLSIDPRQPDKVRVLTTQVVEWLDSDTLTKLSDNYFDGTGQDQLVQGPRSDHSQINANNYIEIIDRVMPLVNAEPIDKLLDVENELLDGSQEIESIPTGDFNSTLSTCPPDGLKLRENIPNVSIITISHDNCRSDSGAYNGSLYIDSVGRDGSTRRLDLTLFDNENTITNGAVRSVISFFRTAAGRTQNQAGTLATYARNGENDAEAIASYNNNILLVSGFDFLGSGICAVERDENGQDRLLSCRQFMADGDINVSFQINATWTSYTDLNVTATFLIGEEYFSDLQWVQAETREPLPDVPVPQRFLDRQNPPTEFLVPDGQMTIEAKDGSMLVADVVSNEGESVTLSVQLFDASGNDMGFFPEHTVSLLCEDRLNMECVF